MLNNLDDARQAGARAGHGDVRRGDGPADADPRLHVHQSSPTRCERRQWIAAAFVRATLAGTAALALAPYAEAGALAFGRRRARLSLHPAALRVRRLGRGPAHAGQRAQLAGGVHHAARRSWGAGGALSDRARLRRALRLHGRAPAGAVLRRERANFERYLRNGGFVFADDCNHDIDGLFARSFEAEMRRSSAPARCASSRRAPPLPRLLHFPDGPPATGIRAQRLGRRPGARLPQGRGDRRPRRRCSTATRTTAASGTTTTATSASWPRTTPSSPSTSSSTR